MLWWQAGFRCPPKFVAMRMTRPRSVKYTRALSRVLPDVAPTCVKTTARKGHTDGGPGEDRRAWAVHPDRVGCLRSAGEVHGRVDLI